MGSTQRETLTPHAAPVPMSSKSARGIPLSRVRDPRAAESVPTIRWTNLADLLTAIDTAPGDALRVTDVSPTVFKMLDEDNERNKIRLSMYTEDTRCLIITVVTGTHEIAHIRLNGEVSSQIRNMGLDDSWESYGSKSYYFGRRPSGSGGGGGGGGEKQADSCGGPVPERRGGYPTLVIESGYSQTLPAVREKIRSWFTDSDHQIKIIILAKIFPTERRILIERWEERPQGGCRQGVSTRWASTLIPECCQTINITETSTIPPAYQIASNDMVLDFRLLFLRNPRQGEGDVIITQAWLQRYARRVWEEYDAYVE
ncbi:uncharacterized protein Triagg1_5048 [Trichoderma aggressivum f. europaeum]|uniref:Uncharacterized protein n=1 Tax=Trichoderma aggressivum f. europaeum TaxID=173218 RepID=A0AAE1IGU5_9HYPO|nr:hypothetical protein Triagg1_5048 [Trichoderma aggressivum f. europaeum]